MAKQALLTASSQYRKIKQGYITVNGVYRRIKQGFVTIGGVYRPFWSTGKVASYGAISKLSVARCGLSATSIGSYAIFGGGFNQVQADNDTNQDDTDAYNASLTKVSIALLHHDDGNYFNAATSTTSHALFAGGLNANLNPPAQGEPKVTAYNSSLTRSYPEDLNMKGGGYLAGASVGNYALFGGGHLVGGILGALIEDWKYEVTAYNTSLSRSLPSNLSHENCRLKGASVGNYALFGGGEKDGSCYNTVDTYNTSLTKGTATVLSIARSDLASASTGTYAIFAGGWTPSNNVANVDAYNSSLTRTNPTSLSVARHYLIGTSVGGFALFGGGTGTGVVDVYDKSLTKQTNLALSVARRKLAATSLGNYALFGGGGDEGSESAVVDVFVYSE